ncbi:MAG: cell division ATP-binding protein FtsE [Solitalea-like symbiont of Acarus siro]
MTKVAELHNASIYQNLNLILSNVTFSISSGELLYLIGSTGSGKSSLLKTLYGELRLKKGSGHCVGYNLNKLKDKQIPLLRRSLGMVFQDFHLLYDRNIEKNLLFALSATGWNDKKAMHKRINEVLHQVGLTNKIKKYPQELSGGEQQRVVIARALLNNPKLILADEPTANLDPATSDEVMDILKKICENGTSIIVSTHNYNLISSHPSKTFQCQLNSLIEF